MLAVRPDALGRGGGDPLEPFWPALLDMAAGRDVAPPTGDCPLWALYASIAQGVAAPAFVVAQLGQSLDGRVATATGKSRYINGPEAIRHLHRLRALVDAVVVGVSTVIIDNPQLSVREVAGPSPARVVVDPNGRIPPGARMLHDDGAPVFIAGRAEACPAGARAITIAAPDGRIEPADLVRALAARGFRRILIEGGATTVSAFLAAGAIDRLHLSIAPMIIGAGPTGINLPPLDELDTALRPRATTYPLGADLLFDCRFDDR